MKNGYLSLLDLNDEELNVFLTYLENGKGMESVKYLNSEFGSNLLEFLDLFAGETIKIPSKNELMYISNYATIYTYLKNKNFTDDAYTRASYIFKRRVPALRKIVDKVKNNIEGE